MKRQLAIRAIVLTCVFASGVLATNSIGDLAEGVRRGELQLSYVAVSFVIAVVGHLLETYLNRKAFYQETIENLQIALKNYGLTQQDDQVIVWAFGRLRRKLTILVYRLTRQRFDWREARPLKAYTPYVEANGTRKRPINHICGSGIVWTAHIKRAVIVDWFPDEQELESRSNSLYNKQGQDMTVRAMLAIPMKRAVDEVVGVIYIRSDRVDAFNKARTLTTAESGVDHRAVEDNDRLLGLVQQLNNVSLKIVARLY